MTRKKKILREEKRINMAGTQRQKLSLAFCQGFHPSGLGFYAGFFLQTASETPGDKNPGRR
jgi:hypothetical protein